MNRDGFTLMEVMIVILIIGTLAALAIPYYRKSMEASRANDALTLSVMIANANKMYKLDRGVWASGQITNSCNTGTCDNTINPPPTDACNLIRCAYVSSHNWDGSKYYFYSCNPDSGAGGGCCATNRVSCAKLKADAGYGLWEYCHSYRSCWSKRNNHPWR